MRLATLTIGLVLLSCAGARHVVVRDSTTSPERRYVCFVAEGAQPAPPCEDSKEDLPGDDNRGHTVVVAMPSQCKGRINEIYVRNADSTSPTVLVRCSAAETMPSVIGPDGGP
jgi:hypothetical protein